MWETDLSQYNMLGGIYEHFKASTEHDFVLSLQLTVCVHTSIPGWQYSSQEALTIYGHKGNESN